MTDLPSLLERDREVAAIAASLDAAVGARGTTMLVTGTAGIGKSSLLAAARDAAQERGMVVLDAVGSPLDRDVAFGIARQWFTHLAVGAERGRTPFDGPGAALLDLVTGATEQPVATDAPSLARATAWVLANMAERVPVLLVADDVQWIDAGSQHLLGLLVPYLRDTAVVLIGGIRTGEPTRDAPALARLFALPGIAHLEPRPLGREAVHQYVAAYIAHEPHPTLVDTLLEVTGGVPFLLQEQLGSLPVDLLVHGREADVVASVRRHASRGVRESVQQRLQALGVTAMHIAQAIVVLADHAGLQSAAAVAGCTDLGAVTAIDQLADAGILAPGFEPLRVAHPLIGEAILDLLGGAATALMHERALHVLRAQGVHSQELAVHALRAPARGDHEVVELLARAAEDALTRGVPDVAATLLDRALREPAPADREVTLLTQCALAHVRANDVDGGIARYRNALSRVDTLDARIHILTRLADAIVFAGRTAQGFDVFDEARMLLDEAGLDAQAPLRRVLAAHAAPAAMLLSATWQGELWTATQAALGEDRSSDTHADRKLYVAAALGQVFKATGSSSEAADLALRGLDGVRLINEESADSSVLYGATAVLLWTNRYEQHRVVVDALIDDARRRGSVLGHASASYCRGGLGLQQGYPRQALPYLRSAVDARHDGWMLYLGNAQAALIRILMMLGEIDAARAAFDEIDLERWTGTTMSAPISAVRGELQLAAGDRQAALETLLDADARRATISPNPAISDIWVPTFDLLVDMGHEDQARDLVETLHAPAHRWGAPRALGLLQRAEARLAPDMGDRRRLLDQSAGMLRSAGCAYELARTLVRLGTTLLESGERALGRTQLDEAADIAHRIGARPLEVEALAVIERASGRPAKPRPLRGMEALTPGEARVVELAARGMTNREIAERLFVTIKAVEWHLSNAYPKLRIKGRRELASVLDLR